ncbi:basic phospholipase A2 homolog 1-like [Porites lutea]|uniref:basic phospholipase A2 homolog 1-like n=1 Tax=Porites lutea TaxID=51062 RepID=UPI003CC615D6
MEGIFVVTLFLLGPVFSFPFAKSSDEDASLLNSELPVENPSKSKHNPDGNVNAKRNLYQFHKMIECSTNLSSYHYHDYGCYCGYGGGGNAVDETDMCCKIHDACYEAISNHPNLCSFESSVYWKIYSRDNTCTGCTDEEGTCGRAICDCDGAAARCFAQAQYNSENFNYPQENC